jgi:DNA-binding response OmpR family regulator
MRALLIDHNEDNRTVYRTILQHFFPDIQLREIHPSDVSEVKDAIEIVKQGYAYIILPLSLPNFNSLRIAEFTHHLNSSTRLILLTISDADRIALFDLFDAVLGRPTEPRRLVAAVQDLLSKDPDRTKSEEQVKEIIRQVLASATCFRVKHNRHDPGRPATLHDYQQVFDVNTNRVTESDTPRAIPMTQNSPWRAGSFYLVAAVVVVATLSLLTIFVSPWLIPGVILGGILLVAVIGAMQLRNDNILSDRSFLSLMRETLKRLPLLKRE